MPTFRLNKLVRDKIPELNKNNWGIETHTELLKGEAKTKALLDKLLEEFRELKNAQGEDRAKELGDIRDVVDALIKDLGLSEEQVEQYRKTRTEKAGGFSDGVFASTVVIPDDHTGPWIDYYRQDPDKFPEITEKHT